MTMLMISEFMLRTFQPLAPQSLLACTTLAIDSYSGRQESAWNSNGATGGGISEVFGIPIYQQSLAMPVDRNGGTVGRGVPDVAAVADPNTGYATFVNGQWLIVGGTSAVAPLYAGLVARIKTNSAVAPVD